MDIKDICLIVTGIVTVASVIVRLTPNSVDNIVLNALIKVLQILSLYKQP